MIDAKGDGVGHGGTAEPDNGATPVEAMVKSSDALYRTTETLRRWLELELLRRSTAMAEAMAELQQGIPAAAQGEHSLPTEWLWMRL